MDLRDWFRRDRVTSPEVDTAAASAATGTEDEASQGHATYADDPLTDLGKDVLDRERLTERVVKVLTAVSQQTNSAVVALVGPWGSGKSTLLNAVERHMKASGKWSIARYNPWSFSSLDAAVSGFFSELRSALPDDTLGKDRRRAVGEFGARMAPLGALGGLVGVDATEGLRELARLVGGDQSPEKLRERAASSLESLDAPVLVLIDDLDRLEPAELLLTFKLVRLLGRLPNVFYVLSYDEATLEAVLQRTDLVGTGRGRARDYLEKMVQVRIDVPPLLSEQKANLVDQALNDFLVRHDVVLDGDATTRLQQQWAHCLEVYLEQPRAVKKLFAQIDAFWPAIAGEVDVVDFIGMTFIRTFERDVYDLVIARKAELTGTDASGLFARDRKAHKDRWAGWLSELKAAEARWPEAVAVLLAELFLPMRSARENMTYGTHYAEEIAARRGVGSAEYFDRYTQLGVPRSDLSDASLLQAIQQLADGVTGVELGSVTQRMGADAQLVVKKLRRLASNSESLPLSALVAFLGKHYVAASQQKSGFLGISPDFGVLLLAVQFLDALPAADARLSIEALCQDPSGLHLAIDALQKTMLAEEEDEKRSWPAAALDSVADAVVAALRARVARPLASEDARVVQLLWGLKHLRGAEFVQRLIWADLLAESSQWSLEDLLGLMVPVGTASDGRSSWPSLGDFGAANIDGLLGLDRVLQAFGDAPVVQFDEDPFDRRRAPVDLQSRRDFALSVVARLIEKRASEPSDAQADDGHSEGEVSP